MHVETFDLATVLRRVRANLGMLLGATGLSMLLGFATVAINARAIGADGVGILALFQASASLVTGLFSFGSQQPMIRLGRQAIEEGRKQEVGLIASVAVVLDILAALIAGSVALVVIVYFSALVGLPNIYTEEARFYTITIFLSGASASNGIFRLLNRFHFIGLAQVMIAISIFAITVLFFVLSAPVSWYLIAYAIIFALGAQGQVAVALLLLRSYGAPVNFRLSEIRRAGIFRRFFSYAWTSNGTSTIDTLRSNLDQLMLGVFFGPSTTGIYSVVRQLTGVINKLSGVISTVIFPEVSVLAARKDYEAANILLKKLACGGFILGMLGVMVSIFFGKDILVLSFGAEFEKGFVALVIMMFAATVMVSAASFGGFVQAFISPETLFKIYFLALLLFCMVSLPATYFAGIDGAAIGQFVFVITLWFGCWSQLRKTFHPIIAFGESSNPSCQSDSVKKGFED